MFNGYRLRLGYWEDSLFDLYFDPQVIITSSNDLSKSNLIRVVSDDSAIKIKGVDETKLYSMVIKNE